MREFKRLLVACIYALLDEACQRFGAGMKRSTGEVVHRGLQYELMPASMLISAAVSFCLLLKQVELLILRPTRHTEVLLFHRAMQVRDGKARSRAILVFFGLDPAPLSFQTRPSFQAVLMRQTSFRLRFFGVGDGVQVRCT